MANLKIGWLTTGDVVAAIILVAVLGYARFVRDMRAARQRLRGEDSQVIETDCGPIEYATFGEGNPALAAQR